MLLVETLLFTRRVGELLSEEEYRQLQLELASRPKSGDVIPGTGGVRKLRWGRGGKGKRGGVRVFYLHREREGRILLLNMIDKTRRGDLPAAELRKLRAAMEEELG